MNDNEIEIMNQLYALLFEIEAMCQEHDFIPPMNIHVMNADASCRHTRRHSQVSE